MQAYRQALQPSIVLVGFFQLIVGRKLVAVILEEIQQLPLSKYQFKLSCFIEALTATFISWLGCHYSSLPLYSAILCSSVLIVAILFVTFDIIVTHLGQQEMLQNLTSLLHKIQKRGGLDVGRVKDPPSRAIDLVRTLRDGQWVMLPGNVLVLGDIVQLSPMDESQGVNRKKIDNDIYEISEPTPLREQIKLMRDQSKYTNNNDNTSILNWSLLFIAILTGIGARVGLPNSYIMSLAVALGVGYILVSPIWSVIWIAICNVRIVCLVEILQKSKTPYTEGEDVDEFDEEAPPPTKDIYVRPFDIFKRLIQAMRGSIPGFLVWSEPLCKILASCSVISFLDREGPVSTSYPLPLELVIPEKNDGERLSFGEFIVDPAMPANIRTNLADTGIEKDDLRALALSLMVSSSCGIHQSHQYNRDLHMRFPLDTFPGRRLDPVFRTCTCAVAREVGFHANAASHYKSIADFWISRDVGISTNLLPVEYQGLFSRVFVDQKDGKLHLFSFGDLTTISCLSSYKWNTSTIERMSEALRYKLIELDDTLAASDLQCIGFSYRPILSLDIQSIQLNDQRVFKYAHIIGSVNQGELIPSIIKDQIFLGALISGYEPKKDMQELIDDLENCGIRFVYFSPYSESITKSYGSRLGLETDWNSCIILSHPKEEAAIHKEANLHLYTDPKSKLPRGVHNIRPHLLDVDDIPLHISLFAECDQESVCGMHKIYDEYNETVICIGSTLSWRNSAAFSTAHLAIGMEPAQIRHDPNEQTTTLEAASFITSLNCVFTLPFDCSPYVITEIIREGRSLDRAQRTGELFRVSVAVMLNLLSIIFPEPLVAVLLLGLLAIVHCLAFLGAPHETDVMKAMPQKKGSPIQTLLYYSLAIRTVVNLIAIMVLLKIVEPPMWIFSMTILGTALFATFLHLHLSVLQFGPWQHTSLWIILSCLLVLATLFLTILAGQQSLGLILLTLLESLVVSIASLALNEAIKYLYKCELEKSEKRAKLQFNTKLGMHSPV